MNIQDKKILVTGGTHGIGRAIVCRLLDEGVGQIVVGSESEIPFEWDELGSRGAVHFQADLGTEDDPQELVRKAHEHMNGLDGLVHCAGVFPEANPGTRTVVDLWNETVNVKARGGYLLASEFSKLANEGGSFVGVSSVNAEQSEPDHLAYDPACAALGGVIRAFAIQYAPRLRFNGLAPGLIETRLTSEIAQSPEIYDHVRRNIPLDRMGQPNECAGTALFLLGDDSAYITGQTIVVDGGISANQMSRPNLD